MQPFSFLKWKTVSPLRRGGSMDGRPHHGLGEIVIDKARAWDSSTARFFFKNSGHVLQKHDLFLCLSDGKNSRCRCSLTDCACALACALDAHALNASAHQRCCSTGRLTWERSGKENEETKTKIPSSKKCEKMSSPRDSDSLSGQFWTAPVVPTHVFFSVTRKLTFKQRRVHNPVDMICIHLYMNSSVRSDARSFGRQGLAI